MIFLRLLSRRKGSEPRAIRVKIVLRFRKKYAMILSVRQKLTNSGESQQMSAEGVTQASPLEGSGACLSLRQKDRAYMQMFYSLEG